MLRSREKNAPAQAGSRRKPGRPPIHDEEWTKVTVVLFNRQIAFLDGLAENISEKSGVPMSRAQLIRAMVDAVADAGLDLTRTRSEADIKGVLLARFESRR
jgi:hypothetical protein